MGRAVEQDLFNLLPPERRLEIYDEVFKLSVPEGKLYVETTEPFYGDGARFPAAVLRVKKETSREAAPVFYGSCIFEHGISFSNWFKGALSWSDAAGSDNIRDVKKVKVLFYIEDFEFLCSLYINTSCVKKSGSVEIIMQQEEFTN